ncbi:hypothetical protein ACT3CD_10100 [Geofilum sp. OHC36d9]|uniref:hypothetical protein n=1 Tax=Geofilum sp. OHC36d9 TaxID=3458413 RepID=UPI0040339E12
MKSLYSALLVALFVFGGRAEGQSKLLFPDRIPHNLSLQEGDVYLSVANQNFFINNELSRLVVKGYTLPGQTFSPFLRYQPSQNFSIDAGLQLKHYFGVDEPVYVNPILTASLKMNSAITFRIGAINGDLNHRLSDIIYFDEYYFGSKPEYGVQFEVNTDRLWLDTWINWQEYIVEGDSVSEQFVAGVSAQLTLAKFNNGWQLTMPLQLMAFHKGGEIDYSDTPDRSEVNTLSGFEFENKNDKATIRWGGFAHVLLYKELKSEKNNVFKDGWGLEAGFMVHSRSHQMRLSWWKGSEFLSENGNPIYQSVSDFDEAFVFPDTQFLTGKYSWHKTFAPQLDFSFLLYGFYDIEQRVVSYSYGVQLLYSPSVFLKNLKKVR